MVLGGKSLQTIFVEIFLVKSFGGKCSGKNLTGKSLAGLEHHTVEINGDVTMETTNEYRTTHLIDTGS